MIDTFITINGWIQPIDKQIITVVGKQVNTIWWAFSCSRFHERTKLNVQIKLLYVYSRKYSADHSMRNIIFSYTVVQYDVVV